MSNNKKESLPQEVIDHWPEVFADLDVQVVPLEYLNSVRIFFADGKVWDIDIAKSKHEAQEDLDKTLQNLFEEYEEHIVNVDFRLDTMKLKRDIQRKTQRFLKRKK